MYRSYHNENVVKVMNSELLLSFIIPAYNASKIIHRCLESIYSLPMQEDEFEVIVIDDSSTDNTIELVKEYAVSHRNIVLLCQQENHRQGAARNLGISIARGNFIAFVDSDDEVGEGIVEVIKTANENSLDMVAMRTSKISGGGVVKESVLPYKKGEVFTGFELQTEHPFWGTAPWSYVYRKSFLQKVNYPFAEDVLYEDSDFVNVHLYHAQRMAYCDECSYHYIESPLSTTNTISYKSVCDYALLGTRMLSFYESLPDMTTKYANSILEGGCYNIMKACRKLIKLKSKSDVKAFYNRFDTHYDRKLLLKYKTPSYCWTWWTRLCIKHKWLAIEVLKISHFFI